MKIRGILKDLLLVGSASLVAVIFVKFDSEKTNMPDASDFIENQTQLSKSASISSSDTSVNDQLAMLRLDMMKSDAAINKRINQLSSSMGNSDLTKQEVNDLVDKFVNQPNFDERISSLRHIEEYDSEATQEYSERVEMHLDQLSLDNSKLSQLSCYASKCVAEVQHETAIDKTIFIEEVLYASNGMFAGKFSYYSEEGPDGIVATKLIFDR